MTHEPVMSGREDVPLSAEGQLQAARLTDYLVRRNARFESIFASPLRRALATALPLVEAGLGPLEVCPELTEIDCGLVDGLPLERVQREYPELWEANLRQEDPQFRWPGGESYCELRSRCLRALRRVAQRRAACVAVVTHAGVISQILGAISGTQPARWECFRPRNGAMTELVWWKGRFICVRFDDRAHLDGAG